MSLSYIEPIDLDNFDINKYKLEEGYKMDDTHGNIYHNINYDNKKFVFKTDWITFNTNPIQPPMWDTEYTKRDYMTLRNSYEGVNKIKTILDEIDNYQKKYMEEKYQNDVNKNQFKKWNIVKENGILLKRMELNLNLI